MAAPRKPRPVRAVTGPGSDADFVFESSAGTITVPSLAMAEQPPPLLIAEILDEFDETRAQAKINLLMLKMAAGDEMYSIIREFKADELQRFTEGWKDHSGVGLGESRVS